LRAEDRFYISDSIQGEKDQIQQNARPYLSVAFQGQKLLRSVLDDER
jgi:hypothetical protein